MARLAKETGSAVTIVKWIIVKNANQDNQDLPEFTDSRSFDMSRRVAFLVALWVVLNLPAICQRGFPQG